MNTTRGRFTRTLILVVFFTGFGFSIYKMTQLKAVSIARYQNARSALAQVQPPAGDRLEQKAEGYQTYRAFGWLVYNTEKPREAIISYYTNTLHHTGWRALTAGAGDIWFSKGDLLLTLSLASGPAATYSLGFHLGDGAPAGSVECK